MIEKLQLRCLTKEEFEPFARHFPKFNCKWITKAWPDSVTVIEANVNDPDFQEFLSYMRSRVRYVISSIIRRYSKKELYSAEILSFWTSSQLDFTAEEAGCEFDTFCSICEAGRVPKNNQLIMNLSQIPKDKDIIDTLSGNELMFSERLKDLVEHHNIKGAELYPVRHWKKNAPAKKWFYVKIKSVVKISEKTVFGNAYQGEHLLINQVPKSSCGHCIVQTETRSEYSLKRNSWDKADIVQSDWYFGSHPPGTVGYPSAERFISQKFYSLLREHNIKGFTVDVAHLV